MTQLGVGSHSSPIVISDDEGDEAFVELELEQRLSSPREGMDIDFDDDDFQYRYDFQANLTHHSSPEDDDLYEDHPSHEPAPNLRYVAGMKARTAVGQKRKRDGSPASPKQRMHPQPLPARPRSPSPGAPPGETKRARKKRRRKELLEARNATQQSVTIAQQNFATGGPPVDFEAYMPVDIPGLSTLTQLNPAISPFPTLSFTLPPSLPPKPMMHPDFTIPVPSLPPPPMHYSLPPVPMYPLPPPPPPPMPSTPSLPPPLSSPQPGAPPPPPQPASTSQDAGPSSDPARKVVIQKKIIGMTPDADPASHHGTYTSPSPTFPPPNPARTLVMELLPKKFRTQAFVRGWASNFGPYSPPRVDLNVKMGKALIEFPSADVARAAWESDRLAGDGKEHIRLWWYRVPGIGADAGVGEIEEGEIEDGEVPKSEAKLNESKKKGKSVQLPLPPKPVVKVKTSTSVSSYSTLSTAVSSTASSSTLGSPVDTTTRHFPPFLHATLPPKPLSFASTSSTVAPALPAPTPQAATQTVGIPQTVAPKSSSNGKARQIPATPPFTPSVSRNFVLQATAPPFVPKQPLSSSTPSAAPRIAVPQQPQTKVNVVSATPATMNGSSSTQNVQDIPSDFVSETATAVPARLSQTVDDDVYSISSSRPGSPAPVTGAATSSPRPSTSTVLPLQIQSPTPKAAQRSPPKAVPVLPEESRPSSTAPPSATSTPRPVFATPTPPPSEPRATRNAPKVPSHAKRKEVEELMARRREELAARSTPSSGSATPVSEVEAMIVDTAATSKEGSPVDPASAVKEDDLRRLVLNSRRAKNTAATTPPVVHAPSAYTARVTVSEVKVQTAKLSLEDMATSFITQSIQAVTIPTQGADNAPLVSPIFSEKALLAAKQQILERNIADQKELMVQYVGARTKADRDRLKAAMAERTRAMEREMDTLGARAQAGKEAARALRFKWPETDRNACILVLSEDEDEG